MKSTITEKATAVAIVAESITGPAIAFVLVVGAFFAPGLPQESRSNLLNTLAGFVAGITFPGAISQISRRAALKNDSKLEVEQEIRQEER